MIGQVIKHSRLWGYPGVIVGWDPVAKVRATCDRTGDQA